MTVIVGRNRTGERARLGLAVRSRSAVTRNRVRRRVKEAFRAASVPEGVDVLVQASEDAAGVEFQKVVDLLERATGKLEG